MSSHCGGTEEPFQVCGGRVWECSLMKGLRRALSSGVVPGPRQGPPTCGVTTGSWPIGGVKARGLDPVARYA